MSRNSFRPQVEALEDRLALSTSPLRPHFLPPGSLPGSPPASGSPAESVLASVSWGGGAGGAVSFSVYAPSQNADLLNELRHMTLQVTSINQYGWWAFSFDQNTKAWFKAHDIQPQMVHGQLELVQTGLPPAA